jgi:hypothetical protein
MINRVSWRRVIAKNALVVFALAGLAGCGNEGDSPDSDLTQVKAAQASELQGIWESNCVDAENVGLTEKARMTITGLKATRVSLISTTGNCASTAIELTQAASFVKGAQAQPNIYQIDITVDSIKLKPTNEAGVAVLKLAAVCGIVDWQVGVEKDVTQLTGTERCFPKLPAKIYTIYTVESDKLYFGVDDTQATDPAKRPTEIDREFVYQKQPTP